MSDLSTIYTTETEPIETRAGCWNYTRVKVLKNGVQIGEYVRNYSSFFGTFFPFVSNGREVALYSKNYTATRLMSLPDCEDIGGEETSGSGFCPTGFYIPTYMTADWNKEDGIKAKSFETNQPDSSEVIDIQNKYQNVSDVLYRPFGFVSGCIWGDDSSWKIEHLDLSQADKGILKRDDRYGYIELPSAMKLKDAIQLEHYEKDWPRVYITIQKLFDVPSGKDLDT